MTVEEETCSYLTRHGGHSTLLMCRTDEHVVLYHRTSNLQ
jgi:hypothetical protein